MHLAVSYVLCGLRNKYWLSHERKYLFNVCSAVREEREEEIIKSHCGTLPHITQLPQHVQIHCSDL